MTRSTKAFVLATLSALTLGGVILAGVFAAPVPRVDCEANVNVTVDCAQHSFTVSGTCSPAECSGFLVVTETDGGGNLLDAYLDTHAPYSITGHVNPGSTIQGTMCCVVTGKEKCAQDQKDCP
jgi:hypothetical protein